MHLEILYLNEEARDVKMLNLTSWHRKKRFPTEDFPMTVQYSKPLHLRTSHYPFSRHPELEFLVVHRGALEMNTSDGPIVLEPGHVALVNPYFLHTFRIMTLDTVSVSVKFPLELIELPPHHYFRQSFIEPMRIGRLQMPSVLTPEHPAHEAVYSALSRLHPDLEELPEYRNTLLATAFALCTTILPYCTNAERSLLVPERSIETCAQYINRHYQEKITLQQLSLLAGLHPNYLCARFKEVMGQTVFSYLTTVRLEHATELITSTELSVAEICHRCGFHSVGFFSKKFKERHGLTPKQLHKKLYKPNL